MPKKRKRYAIVILVVMMLGLGFSVMALAYKVVQNGHNICDELIVLSSVPVIKPADPIKHPAQEELWKEYIATVTLKKNLGCNLGEA